MSHALSQIAVLLIIVAIVLFGLLAFALDRGTPADLRASLGYVIAGAVFAVVGIFLGIASFFVKGTP